MKLLIFITIILTFIIFGCSYSKKYVEKIENKDSLNSDSSKQNISEIAAKKDRILIDENDIFTWPLKKLAKEMPYDYFDTILSNGYHLSFSYFTDEEYISKCLILKKGKKYIDTLNIMGAGAPDKNLGYIAGDFNKYFAFAQSFGSGNPHEMQLISKEDGDTLRTGYIVKSINSPDLLIYEDHRDNKLKIYDFIWKKDIDISTIKVDCFTWQMSELINIDSMNTKMIYIDYADWNGNKTKYKFNR